MNIYKDLEKPISFEAIGKCNEAHCYNGHAFLTLGNIPELKTPVYATLRNRIMTNGEEWLNPKMKAFLSQKLNNSNEEYSIDAKRHILFLRPFRRTSLRINQIFNRLKND